MNLPVELRNSRRRPIILKIKIKNIFLWCHVTHINPSKEHPEKNLKDDKKNY